MGTMFGDTNFEDYGNAPEVFIQNNAIPAWERLNDNLARLFICREIGVRRILDHTDLIDKATLVAIGKRFLEIAEEMEREEPTLWSRETTKAMLC